MKKQKYVIVFLITILSLFSFGSVISAESSGNSDAIVNFTEGTTPPDVVDPTDPDKPIDKEDPENPTNPPTENTGPLSMDYVSSVDFGTNQISSKRAVYESTSKKPFIQVSDARGTGSGWDVTASVSNFVNDSGESSLPGAALSFENGEIKTTSDNVSQDNPPTGSQNIVLATDGTPANVMTANNDQGLGTWIERWFPTKQESSTNNNVTLAVPAGSASTGTHTAEVTWTLTSAPTQP